MSPPARLAPRARRTAVAAVALLLIGAAISALTIAGSQEGRRRPGKPAQRPPARETTTRSAPHRLAPLVRAAQLMRARDAAERFLDAFLAYEDYFRKDKKDKVHREVVYRPAATLSLSFSFIITRSKLVSSTIMNN